MKKLIKNVLRKVLSESKYDELDMSIWDRKKTKEELNDRKKNIKYKDIHKGKRCFILGNGPSLRNVDLKLLKDEYVFTVNNFSQVENYREVKTNFHIWADYSFFDMRDDQKYNMNDIMENYHLIAKENPICFFPYEARLFVKKNMLDEVLDVNYFSCYAQVENNKMIHYDISKYITGFSTVVQYAIVIALYMGFKEIYLLGCDSTNVVSLLNCAMNISNENMHAYDDDDVDVRYKKLLENWKMTDIFHDQYILFLGYKKLYERCVDEGVTLCNCSSNTLINEVPREKLADILVVK